ncbi:hypothetical protein VNO78_16185 [Psophocarpus tetragonolobus]|uniref:Uncharacterized protein n=1 Tax=Psophocarpus tetragonolobus TaxID=3891 RepID=A0AAN9XKJ8_PSOTE
MGNKHADQVLQTVSSSSLFSFRNNSRILYISVGVDHKVIAFRCLSRNDITDIEILNPLPLVHRDNPHNLPFFVDAFDLFYCAL